MSLLPIDIDGISIYVEPYEEPGSYDTAAKPFEAMAERMDQLEEAISSIGTRVAGMASSLRQRASSPDELELAFSVALRKGGGVVIASASAEATFSVRILYRSDVAKP